MVEERVGVGPMGRPRGQGVEKRGETGHCSGQSRVFRNKRTTHIRSGGVLLPEKATDRLDSAPSLVCPRPCPARRAPALRRTMALPLSRPPQQNPSSSHAPTPGRLPRPALPATRPPTAVPHAPSDLSSEAAPPTTPRPPNAPPSRPTTITETASPLVAQMPRLPTAPTTAQGRGPPECPVATQTTGTRRPPRP